MKKFVLTHREEDVREIYQEKLNYKLLSENNYASIFLGLLFLLLFFLALSRSRSYDEYFFLSLLFLLGLGYQIRQLFIQYWEFNKGRKEIESFLDKMKNYRSHTLEFGKDFFTYKRDTDVYVYEIKKVKSTYQTELYFYFLTTDNESILLPKKAFAEGEYDKFIQVYNLRNP